MRSINWLPHRCLCVLSTSPEFMCCQIHKDPFDRMLIAQATAEGLTLVSADLEIARYATKSLRVVV
jgi:PIN domain nuclease of toxin-antitoxin system